MTKRIKHIIFMVGLYVLICIAAILWWTGALFGTIGDMFFALGDYVSDIAKEAIYTCRRQKHGAL